MPRRAVQWVWLRILCQNMQQKDDLSRCPVQVVSLACFKLVQNRSPNPQPMLPAELSCPACKTALGF